MKLMSFPRGRSLAIGAFLLLLVATTATASQPTDRDVTIAIEDEMLLDRAVPFNGIDAVTVDGVVTLTGTVDNLLAKNRATELAEAVKGVRAVINRIDVRPRNTVESSALADRVERALMADPATDSWEIVVDADKAGAVTLSGTVQSWQEHELCAQVASGVAGVTHVDNRIRVAYTTERSDLEIKPEIEKVLRWDALVDHALIDVTVDDGNVTLDGIVGSAAEKRRAVSDAWVPGVNRVNADGLEVARWARDDDLRTGKYVAVSDGAIREAIADALTLDPRVFSLDVEARVQNGHVTLHGIVDNAKAKRAAAETAANVVGVIDVRNYVKVRPVEELNDDQIAKKVERAIARDAWLRDEDLTIAVDDGEVFLYGDVNWDHERERALDLAFRTRGVTEVHNYVTVHSWPTAWLTTRPGAALEPWNATGPTARGTDHVVEQAIESQLWWSPFVDANDVTVEVRDLTAYLSGTVDSWMEYRAAAQNALEGGAVDLRNDLVVDATR